MWKPGQIVTIVAGKKKTRCRVMNIESCIKRLNGRHLEHSTIAIRAFMDIYRKHFPMIKKYLSQSDMLCPLEIYPKTK